MMHGGVIKNELLLSGWLSKNQHFMGILRKVFVDKWNCLIIWILFEKSHLYIFRLMSNYTWKQKQSTETQVEK